MLARRGIALNLATAPATEPISLAEAKAHLRVDHADDDATITLLISVTRQYVDAVSGWLGRALVTQTWDFVLDQFPLPMAPWCCYPLTAAPPTALQVPWPPLQSVTSIKYIDVNGAQQTMPAGDYRVDAASTPGWILPVTTWPATKAVPNAVEIRFVAGYGDDAADVPAPIRQALLLMIGAWYENREQVIAQYEGNTTVLSLPLGAEQLLAPYRMILV